MAPQVVVLEHSSFLFFFLRPETICRVSVSSPGDLYWNPNDNESTFPKNAKLQEKLEFKDDISFRPFLIVDQSDGSNPSASMSVSAEPGK